jgi:hypothetical protein
MSGTSQGPRNGLAKLLLDADPDQDPEEIVKQQQRFECPSCGWTAELRRTECMVCDSTQPLQRRSTTEGSQNE